MIGEKIVIFVRIITIFVFIYPIFMGFVWLLGALEYKLFYRKKKVPDDLKQVPFTILMPSYNEATDIYQNVMRNLELDYDNYEVWVIDDQSTDATYSEVMRINHSKLKVFQNPKNQGKARTLNEYIDKLTTDYFIVIDSDTIFNNRALKVIANEINQSQDDKVVAYTGNMTVHGNQKNALLMLQKIEYRAYIDLIKKTQMVTTRSIATLSGACSIYNTSKVKEIGYFNVENATEDINISWRFNQAGYRLKYIPQMYASVTTPQNIFDLVSQRKRWTTGAVQTIAQNKRSLLSIKNYGLILFVVEYVLSSVWAWLFLFVQFYYLVTIIFKLTEDLYLLSYVYSLIIILIASTIVALGAYLLENNERENPYEFIKYYSLFPFIYYIIQPIGYISGFINYFKKMDHGKWRRNSDENQRLIFSNVVDFIATVYFTRFIMEALEDFGTTHHFSHLQIVVTYIWYVIGIIIYIFMYYKKLRFGEKCVNRKYNYRYSAIMYVTLLTVVLSISRLILFMMTDISYFNLYRYVPLHAVFLFIVYIVCHKLLKRKMMIIDE